MAGKFVHLHLHTEYSLLDGLSKIPKLITRVKEMDMDSVAVTDHGTMYGAIDFYKKAKAENVKPIIGVEAYTVQYNHKEKPSEEKFNYNHLLLLAKNEEGYKNLMKITSIAHMEGYYYRPRIQRELLEKYAKGIICTSACVNGEVPRALIDGNYEKAKKTAKWFYDIFGKDYYLEIQRHEYDKYVDSAVPEMREELRHQAEVEKIVNDGIVKLSRDMGIPLIATNDAHYINKEDAIAQDALVCVATGKHVNETKRIRMVDTPTYYARPYEEMAKLFPDFPDALENTVKIAKKCNLEISTLGKWFFPEIKIPDNKKPDEYLKELAYERLPQRIEKVTDEIKKRLDYELDVICTKGYPSYFLLVMELANWSNNAGIITNTRGSAAGSLVSYVLGITTVNPIQYELPFERFLNPLRPSAPDIDFDVADVRRDDIITHIADTYGHDKVAQICTFGRMLARAAVRDVARVLGYEYAVGDRISKMIPPPKQGFPVNVEKAFTLNPALDDLYKNDSDAKKILDLAKQLEGSARHISMHAAGVVVAPSKMTDFSPIQKEQKEGKVITQYEMHACEDVGLVKLDILGIRNLSILGMAVEIVKQKRGKEVDFHKIPLDDKKTFEMLSRGETMGVFQLSSAGMTKYLKELKPERIEDIMQMVALYRPGPIAFISEYIERKHDPSKITYLDPRMEGFLKKSMGLLVYQDDVLYCAMELAGYDWGSVDKFRKAIGKKIPGEMQAQKEIFINGCVEHGMTLEKAQELFGQIETFAAYGFNKAHAASYGMVSYQTAYMKANYPVEYMTALLTCESGDKDKVSEAITECRRMGIEVLPPDINKSSTGFTIEKNSIRFGLSAIKNVGHAAIEAILEGRKDLPAQAGGEFMNLADFLSRVDARKVNKKVLESLIKVGALANFGKRAAILSSIDEIKAKIKPKKATSQQDLFGDEMKMTQAPSATIADIAEFSDIELETLERQLLGFSLSAKPLHEIIGELINYATHKTGEINHEVELPPSIKIAGIISEVRVVITKKSQAQMAFAKIEDESGLINAVIFPKLFKDYQKILTENTPVLITGKVDFREDEANILVDKIETKETLDTNQSAFFVKIPANTSIEKLKNLKSLLLENPGKEQVTLIFAGKDKTMTLPFGISWSQTLSHKISDLLDTPKEKM